MIIEEPEAHLHIKLQRIITRALARLVNKGLPIWITTHSDIIFQQINNLIKLNNIDYKRITELGYEEQEILKVDDVTAYQFIINNKKTIVEKLNIEERGFPAPTFNETLYNFSKETLLLAEELNDND